MNEVDGYINSQPEAQREALKAIRRLVLSVVPDVDESIAYGMPAYRYKGKRLLYFAAFARHIGFYPLPSSIENFKNDLLLYKQGKGSVQFPLSQPLPLALIEKIVKAKVAEINR